MTTWTTVIDGVPVETTSTAKPATTWTSISGSVSANNASNITFSPAGSGSVNTTVETKLREFINVNDFGAVGGSTDDTAAFQAAINFLPSSGGTIYGNKENYSVTSLTNTSAKPIIWMGFKNINNNLVTKLDVLPGLVIHSGEEDQLTIGGTGLRLTKHSDTTKIEPALFLRKDSTVGLPNMGLAKIQWRGTDDTGKVDRDAGRISAVITDPSSTSFNAIVGVSPHVQGNEEAISAIKFGAGVVIGSEDGAVGVTITDGGSGYAILDKVSLVGRTGGQKAEGVVTEVTGGAIVNVSVTSIIGHAYEVDEVVDLVAITGTGTNAYGVVIIGEGVFFQGLGTLNIARSIYLGGNKTTYIPAGTSDVYGIYDNIRITNGTDILFDYGAGQLSIGSILRMGNTATLSITNDLPSYVRVIGDRTLKITEDATISLLYKVHLVDATSGNIIVTLPDADVNGTNVTPIFFIRRIDASANTVTVQRAGTDTINGTTSETLSAGEGKTYYGNSVNSWYSH